MSLLPRSVRLVALPAALVFLPAVAGALPPRSERVTARIAERAYARQAIAEARAEKAGARVEAIAPVAPVPPPPRPATVRRMLRAGVPLEAIVGAPPPGATLVVVGLPQGAAAPAIAARSPAFASAAPIAAAPSAARGAAAAPPKTLADTPAARPVAPPPVVATTEPANGATLAFPPPAAKIASGDVATDGTRSVLVTADEPAGDSPAQAGPSPAGEVIELIPLPAAR